MEFEAESKVVSDKTICEAIVQIKNVDGLNMRAATRFIEMAEVSSSNIIVRSGGKVADSKSIMQMCMLAAPCGSKLRITAEGQDAQETITALSELVGGKAFGESARRR